MEKPGPTFEDLERQLGGSASEQRHLKLQPMAGNGALGYFNDDEYAELEHAMTTAGFRVVAATGTMMHDRSVLYEAPSGERLLIRNHETGPELIIVWLVAHQAALTAGATVASILSGATGAIKNVFDIIEKAHGLFTRGNRQDDATSVDVIEHPDAFVRPLASRDLAKPLTDEEAADYIKRLVGTP